MADQVGSSKEDSVVEEPMVAEVDSSQDIETIIDEFLIDSSDEPQEAEAEPEPEPESKLESKPAEEPAEELVTDAEGSEEPVVEDELSSLKSQNQALLEHVERISGQLLNGVKFPTIPATEQPQQSSQPSGAQPPMPGGVPNFLGEITVDELLEDPAKLNLVLARVAQAAQDQAVNLASQQTLRSIPELVIGYITRHTAMNRLVDEFYKENTDLASVKQTVAAVANTVHSENPDWTLEKVFGETADRTRKLLGLRKQAQAQVKPQTKKPAFAKNRGARREDPQIGGIQKEINDLLLED
jgi:hypothetical protein